jgi:transposase
MEVSMDEFAAYVGIDWSDQKHDCCLMDAVTGKRESSTLSHSSEAIDKWASGLRARFPGRKIAICLEQSRGPLIYALMKYDFIVLYPINPSTLSSYREAFSPSGAKDDPTDADYMAEIVSAHRDRLRPWRPDDEQTRRLQYLVEHRRKLVGERTRLSNRLTALLKDYFPQVLQWFPDVRTTLVCDFLTRWPTLWAVKRARRKTLQEFFRAHNSNRQEVVERRIKSIEESLPLVTDQAVVRSSALLAGAWVTQMKVIVEAIKEFDREIEQVCSQHQDYPLFASLPGAGTVYASRMLAAFGTQRGKFSSADELACLVGIAPVIERSGKSCWVRWRYFCPKFVRQTFHEYAGESILHSFWAKAYYESQRAKGKSHAKAVRALAYKWIRIIWKCWESRTTYDEVKYLESLRKRNSPLLRYAASHPE